MPIYEYHCCSCGKDFPLVPKLQLGNGLTEAGASAQLCSQAGAWEQEAKDVHAIEFGIKY
jgi:predicted nucleic acid-binding Zn ribbon protein